MAEVIWNHLGDGMWHAVSAGSDPAGYVHPMAIETLKSMELPTDGLHSKSVSEFSDQAFDLVVTVCDNAKKECPVFAGAKQTLHWPFEDPNDAEGNDFEKMKVFRSVADLIRGRVGAFLAKLKDDDLV
jgi:arsenate reductase